VTDFGTSFKASKVHENIDGHATSFSLDLWEI